ncbi:MAG TPA: UDP-N-acetylglucosamine 1-carboxyvinyltransferase [Actinomycetota bacterium]|jgi:UDP-N-acetylglucosamine 1-carboxyvinyltransferase|nr:UDP-N-acetylglucosamine 1-carboxyvinyltransferase [Actinomycetota bacterium]
MDRLLVTGGTPLSGTVPIAGAKNSALKLMAASLLAEGRSLLRNVPQIQDCRTMVEVLEHLGAGVSWADGSLAIDATDVRSVEAPYELVSRMRASILVLGPLLARFGRARVAMPGGCNIGSRKIDLHIRGLEDMGVRFTSEHGFLEAEADELRGAVINLDFPSVGATENVMMAAVAARGTTVIENAAREPELADLADLLAAMGARISGVGTPTIEIEGVAAFAPIEHTVIPDRVEAGTFAIAVCATGGRVALQGARADHMDLVLSKLADAGATASVVEDGIELEMAGGARCVDLVTLPYPGFPTDLQPQMMALLAGAEGTSIVTENVFESRFMFVDELNRMGADIRTEGHHAVIRGVERLSAAPVRALDIRAGAAMVIAGLAADGVTEVEDMYHVDRGYQDFEAKLTALGAEVRRERHLSPALS